MNYQLRGKAFAVSRRRALGTLAAATAGLVVCRTWAQSLPNKPALVVISMDLEMSRHYPRWGMTEWDYRKGDLDAATKRYAVEAAQRVKSYGGRIHFFALGQTLEQPDVSWLKKLAHDGHPVGNHTYDHINLKARSAQELQFRFRRAPWLIEGQVLPEVIQRNIRMTTRALELRCGIQVQGFRTPGGFSNGLRDRPDLQRMLLELGFRWVSSLYPRHPLGTRGRGPSSQELRAIVAAQKLAQPFLYPTGLVEIPMSPVSDVGAFRSGRWPLEAWLNCLRESLRWVVDQGGVFDFLCHPSCLVVEDPKFQAIELICRFVRQHEPRVRLATLEEVAARVRSG